MRRGILALILVTTMLFAMTAANVSAIAKPSSPTILIESANADNSQEVSVKVTIENNPGMWGMDLRISYNRNALTLVSVDNGDFFQASEWTEGNLDADVYILSYEASKLEDITAYSGTLAILNFKVSDTATAGSYAVTASYNPGDIINVNFEDLNFDITNGEIRIQPKTASVMGVTIDETLSVKTGETKIPSFAVFPAEATNQAVSFKSSDPAIATVDKTTGAVTGVKSGTATITITTTEGGFTDMCTVTVACAHLNKETIYAQESDCTTRGWDTYKKCEDCNQFFDMSDLQISEVPFRELSNEHRGGTATCTAKAVCTVCFRAYGDFAAHSFTEEIKDDAHLVPGSGKPAQYYYDCAYCEQMGTDTFSDVLKGDLDGDGDVDEDDAIYLLQHVLMPEFFPVERNADYDGSGQLDEDDAIYLLQHVLMPEFFPLMEK